MGAKRVDVRERNRRIAEAALPLFLERPREQVTLAAIAEAADMTYWQVFRAFGNSECVYRAAVAGLVGELARDAAAPPPRARSAAEAVRSYAKRAAALIGSERYRQFLYLLIRDGCAHPWLEEAYRERLLKPLRGGLRAALADAGGGRDATILLRDDAGQRFVGTLEAALAVPKLIPGFGGGEGEGAVAKAAAEALAAGYPLERAAAA